MSFLSTAMKVFVVLAVMEVVVATLPVVGQLINRNFITGRDPIPRSDLARLTGSRQESLGVCTSVSVADLDTSTTIPSSYNVHEEYSACAPTIRDQGQCGSCWAFAVTGVVAQRMCVQSAQIDKAFRLSPQNLVSCTSEICYSSTGDPCDSGTPDCRCSLGCDGGYPDGAFRYMSDDSIALEYCVPYVSSSGDDGSTCSEVRSDTDSCDSELSYNTTFTTGSCYYHSSSDIETIQRDIMQHGPVLATYSVYEDFYTYGSGVYTCPDDGSDAVGAHAVIIVGWGTESSMDYWLAENSWSDGWGDGGYFKIQRGNNECNFEANIVATLVNTEGVTVDAVAQSSASVVMARFSGVLAIVLALAAFILSM